MNVFFHHSELCFPFTPCNTTLIARKRWTTHFAANWWCVCPHRWSLNGTLINLGLDHRRRLSGGNLIIGNLDRYQDVGMYQCMAYNTVGAILSRRASLQFACKLINMSGTFTQNCSKAVLRKRNTFGINQCSCNVSVFNLSQTLFLWFHFFHKPVNAFSQFSCHALDSYSLGKWALRLNHASCAHFSWQGAN